MSADGLDGDVPAWPLLPDVEAAATLGRNIERVESLNAEIEAAEDGRTRGRLRRELEKTEMAVTLANVRIEQASEMEIALWEDLWSSPQAVLWEESHAQREVAQYVRWKIRAEQGDLKASSEARQLSDRLGLNPLALLRLRAEIERVDEVENQGKRRRSSATPPKPADDGKPDARAILSVV